MRLPIREDRQKFLTAGSAAALVVLVPLAALLIAAGRDPVSIIGQIVSGAFGTWSGFRETLIRATPLLLCGLAAAVPARAGLTNIGGEGQLLAGAWGATYVALFLPGLPGWSVLPAVVLAAAVAGAVWAAVPGLLRAGWGVNEVLVTLMLNYVAANVIAHLVHGPWRDPGALGWPYTVRFPDAATLPTWGNTRVHLGLVIGVVAAVFLAAAVRATTWGFQLRVVADNPRAAQSAGLPVGRVLVLAMLVGGAAAGLAGLGEVSVVHGRLRPGLSPGYGYSGFLVACLARHHPLGVVPVAIVVGGLYSGADALQLSAGLPSSTVDILIGLSLIAYLVGWQLAPAGRRPTADSEVDR